MDLSRFFLYTALAVVSYLLLLAWNEDYPQSVSEAVTTPPAELPSAPETGTPTTTPADVPNQVPQAQTLTAASNNSDNGNNAASPINASTNATTQTDQSRLITVTSDTLSLSIDLDGGDITYLALPQHLRQIDVPDEPFVLLESGPSRSYVAQSGLIGVNGIDNESRAQYQSSSTTYS